MTEGKLLGSRLFISLAQRTTAQYYSLLSSHVPAANSDKEKELLLPIRVPRRYRGGQT